MGKARVPKPSPSSDCRGLESSRGPGKLVLSVMTNCLRVNKGRVPNPSPLPVVVDFSLRGCVGGTVVGLAELVVRSSYPVSSLRRC